MTIDYLSLIFMSLLPLASSTVTSGQDHNFTDVMSGEVENGFTHGQLTNQETTSFNPHSEILGHDITQSVLVDVNPEEKTPSPTQNPEPRAKPLLQTAATTPLKILFPNIQTAVTPTNSISSQSRSSTVGLKPTTSSTTVVTSSARNPTTTTGPPSMLRSTKTQETGETSQSVSDKITYSSTQSTPSTNLNSTTTTSTKPVEKESTSTGPVTGGDAMSTGFDKTSLAITKTPIIHITNKRQNTSEKSKNGPNHGKAVAGLIGGALVLMMVGFLVIYIKKRKLQRQQITTRDWAGPSPFLEGGVDNDQVTLRSSNRISLSSFLPQRLSKRLSMLPETDEELKDMTSGTTFGDQHQESLNSQNVDGNDIQKSNGSAVVNVGLKSTGNAPKNVENSISVPSSQTDDLMSINNNMEVTNLIEDHPVNPPTLSGAVENGAFSHQNEDLGQP